MSGNVLINPFLMQAGLSVPPAPTIINVTVTEYDIDFWIADITWDFPSNGGAEITAAEAQVDLTALIDGLSGAAESFFKPYGTDLTWMCQTCALNTSEGFPVGSHNARARGFNSAGWGPWSADYLFTI
jgi:hypothetical protein